MTAETPAEQSLFDRPVKVLEDLVGRARAGGWPSGLVERALRIGYQSEDVDAWLKRERKRPYTDLAYW